MIRDCVVTSRAVVGSSAMSTAGREDMAIAIMTRCRIPPENSCGYWPRRSSGSGTPTSVSSSTARARAAAAETRSCSRIASTSWCPIVRTGFSDDIGS